ncbi:MAG: HAMP domain-containing histidine kinase [Clostridia bacterium]|nr:HAMP domain-containing histidine kinase [Clostridia bacterium]
MDTKLKNFNGRTLLKIIAFMLCICCVVNCTSSALSTLYKVDEYNISDYAYGDAVRSIYMNQELTKTSTFKHHMSDFSYGLESTVGRYGDGSEEAYNQWKSSIEKNNDEIYKRSRQNLINHVIADEFNLYLALVEKGLVTPLGLIADAEYSGSTRELYVWNITDYGISYNQLFGQSSGVVKYVDNEDVKKKAEELKADGVFKLNNNYQILDTYDYYDDDYYEGADEYRIVTTYKPGYYAFKINDEVFKATIDNYDFLKYDTYGSAEEFKRNYQKFADTLNEEYPSGKYYINAGGGKVYTNIDGLDAKSTREEIIKKLEAFGFYCYGNGYGDMHLPNGDYYTYGGFNGYRHYSDEYGYYYDTTTLLTTVVTTQPQTTMVVVNVNGEEVTTPVSAPAASPEPTTAVTAIRYLYDDGTPFVDESADGWGCYFAVDMHGDYPETDRFRTVGTQIALAEEIIGDLALTLGVMGMLFLVCFIYLVITAGRRKGEKEAYLLKTDRIFVDLRIAIDGLLGFGVFALAIWAVDELADEVPKTFIKVCCVLAALIAVLVLDLVLFIVRHIKARTLFKRLSLVWIIRWCIKFYKEKIKAVIDEKFLYTREFAKGTLIRIGIVAVANLFLGFCASIEVMNNGTCFISVPWVLFNAGVLVWVIRFVGSMHKIFTALEEIRQGNYNVYINTYAMPKTLRESADKVMSLRDGLKTAVEEAVKQEQTKTELITNVSHDLKTPLTSIINYVELLKKCEINDSDAIEYLDVLGEKSDRLKKLIEDLVEASKASTGNIKVEFVEVSLNEMVSQLLGEHADGLEKKKLNVVAEFPERELTVQADGKLLYRVMENLIVNVEKYSLYGTRVYVSVKQEGEWGVVTFKNISELPLNITADQLKERFVRGDESRSTEGNGLGLSIAQSLCDVQGGELEISINGDLFTAKVKLKK